MDTMTMLLEEQLSKIVIATGRDEMLRMSQVADNEMYAKVAYTVLCRDISTHFEKWVYDPNLKRVVSAVEYKEYLQFKDQIADYLKQQR